MGTKEMDKNVTRVDVVLFPPPDGDSEGDSDPEDEPTGNLNRLNTNMLNNYAELVEHIEEVEEEGGSGSDSDDSDIQNPNVSDIDNPQP